MANDKLLNCYKSFLILVLDFLFDISRLADSIGKINSFLLFEPFDRLRTKGLSRTVYRPPRGNQGLPPG